MQEANSSISTNPQYLLKATWGHRATDHIRKDKRGKAKVEQGWPHVKHTLAKYLQDLGFKHLLGTSNTFQANPTKGYCRQWPKTPEK